MDAIMELVSDIVRLPLIWLVLTVAAFQVGLRLNRAAAGLAVVNPVLIALPRLICAVLALGVDYDSYVAQGGGLGAAVLGPATVALAVPLYNNAGRVRRAVLPMIAAVVVGGASAAASAFALAWLLQAPGDVASTIAVKSVTAPIAIGVAEQVGGIPSLAAAFAVMTGVAGTMLAPCLLRRSGIRSWEATGLAAGVTAHGQATARMLTLDEAAGAFASVGMGLNALCTAIWLPFVAAFLVS